MILVLTTYRTGSTYFCKTLADENNLANYDEMFHEHLKDHHKANLIHLEKNTNAVVKLMPWHLQNTEIPNLLPSILELSERNIFLIRPDFDSQVQSYYVAKYLSKTEQKTWHEEWDKPIKIELDKEYYQRYVNFLQKEYYTLSDLYNKLKNKELVFTNQLEQNKYKRPIIWDKKPGYTNIDIEELFV